MFKLCIFSTVLIVIIVIISIIGIIVIAAGIFFVCLCYCAAFNQNRLTRFFIKPKTNTEIERERIQYLEKIKKRPAYPANYFDELRRKSPAPRTFDDENNNNTGTPTSSGNEKTFKSKKQQEQKVLQPMGEKNKSLLELFPPATITTAKTTKIGTPKNGSVYCNNDKLRSNYAGSPNDKPTAAAATDLSPTDKPSISPNDKQT
uniref:Uncharacterized protein n=1 Tax=Panagrolaimus sp. PS1159 TaxID=55785 RepID=A0AC35GJB6_9BILA